MKWLSPILFNILVSSFITGIFCYSCRTSKGLSYIDQPPAISTSYTPKIKHGVFRIGKVSFAEFTTLESKKLDSATFRQIDSGTPGLFFRVDTSMAVKFYYLSLTNSRDTSKSTYSISSYKISEEPTFLSFLLGITLLVVSKNEDKFEPKEEAGNKEIFSGYFLKGTISTSKNELWHFESKLLGEKQHPRESTVTSGNMYNDLDTLVINENFTYEITETRNNKSGHLARDTTVMWREIEVLSGGNRVATMVNRKRIWIYDDISALHRLLIASFFSVVLVTPEPY